MEGNRHDGVGALEQICGNVAQPRGQRLGQGALPAVLEGMNELAQHALIPAGASGHLEAGPLAFTAETPGSAGADRRQRIRAAEAQRRAQQRKRSPARLADRPAERPPEDFPADHARGPEQDLDD